jgi:hypothetical protein
METQLETKKMNTNQINKMEAKKFLDEMFGKKLGYVKIEDKRNHPFAHPDVCQWKITEIENISGYGFNDETLFINNGSKQIEISLKCIEQITSHKLFKNDKEYALLIIMDSVRYDY